jgi:hypothetical protein
MKPKSLTLKLVLEEPRLLCAIQIFPNTFVHVAELSLEGNIPSLFCGARIDPMSAPLLVVELEILAPSWAISNVPTHLMSTLTWERFVVLY